jgi:hypothetical protein
MITDRKKFLFSFPGTSVKRVQWLKKVEQRQAYRPNNPMVVNMYAGITKHGVTKAHLVTGTSKLKTIYKNKKGQPSRNITSAEYEDVVTNTLLPEGARIFAAAGLSGWILQQDNDPTHKGASARALKAWNGERKASIEPLKNWPPNSPDLSPIENAWAHVQATVNGLQKIRGIPSHAAQGMEGNRSISCQRAPGKPAYSLEGVRGQARG